MARRPEKPRVPKPPGPGAAGHELRRRSSPSSLTPHASHQQMSWPRPGCKPNFVRRERCRARREHHSSEQPIPGTRPVSRPGGGPPQCSLFGLAPDGVCHAASLALRAVRSYRTFSPLPGDRSRRAVCSLWHCPSESVSAFRPRVSPVNRSYAASRPVEFGLSSPGEPGAILRPSKARTSAP
jgi:hypothetical protein